MSTERDERAVSRTLLTGIHLDLVDRSVTLLASDDVVARITLAPEGVVFQAPVPDLPLPSPNTSSSDPEKEKPQTFHGRLKSTPKPGRPDRNKQPTAWARFAAHIEGEDGAVLYSMTFHRHTAPIALTLGKDAQITVQGYPHPADDPDTRRMATLSVINLLDYPGKQKS